MHDIWNPWHGCRKCSEGCQNCYMYYMGHTDIGVTLNTYTHLGLLDAKNELTKLDRNSEMPVEESKIIEFIVDKMTF